MAPPEEADPEPFVLVWPTDDDDVVVVVVDDMMGYSAGHSFYFQSQGVCCFVSHFPYLVISICVTHTVCLSIHLI